MTDYFESRCFEENKKSFSILHSIQRSTQSLDTLVASQMRNSKIIWSTKDELPKRSLRRNDQRLFSTCNLSVSSAHSLIETRRWLLMRDQGTSLRVTLQMIHHSTHLLDMMSSIWTLREGSKGRKRSMPTALTKNVLSNQTSGSVSTEPDKHPAQS